MNAAMSLSCLILALQLGVTHAETAGTSLEQRKRRLVAEEIRFSDAEAGRFWPLYEDLQREWCSLEAKRAALMGEFGSHYDDMPETEAKKLTLERLAIEEERLRLFRSYLPKFEKVLCWRRIARYYQIEGHLNAAVNAEIARELPLIK